MQMLTDGWNSFLHSCSHTPHIFHNNPYRYNRS